MDIMITNPLWFLLVGGLLLFIGLSSSRLKLLPVTPAIIYLAVGTLVGPTVLNLFHFNPLKESALLEVLTEVAVLISLFSAGVKMPTPVSFKRWRAPVLLATVSMTLTVAMVAAYSYYVFHLPLGACVLLGAIVAPTDPVLATDIQIRHPGDHDQLRFTLTCEAGMNDGSATPFVMLGMGLLGLHEAGDTGMRWFMLDVIFIGLSPNTGFLGGAVDLDANGFITTTDTMATNIPGVFAAGDCRHGSTKQIASAVGEGATAAIMIRSFLSMGEQSRGGGED